MKIWLEKLRDSKKLIIVEGKNDKSALESLGIKNIISISREPLYSFMDHINAKEVIILTDLDPAGKKLYSVLKHNLQARGVKIDNYFREYLFKNSKLTHIEGIFHYLKKEGTV